MECIALTVLCTTQSSAWQAAGFSHCLGPRAQARQQAEAGAQLAAEKKALVETVRRQAQSVARLDAFRRNLLATLQTSPDVRPRQRKGCVPQPALHECGSLCVERPAPPPPFRAV